jgi:glycosyltransferase involved in cell wall biosynthesis
MHPSVLGFFAGGALSRAEVDNADVIEVGSQNINGSVRPIIEMLGPRSYTGVDRVAGDGVDQVVDCTTLVDHFGPNSFDVVVSTEMLEHVEDWRSCIANLIEVLRPGGTLVLTTRSVGFPHHCPPDHWRYTLEAVGEILDLANLEQLIVCTDPDRFSPGVFAKARKPVDWLQPNWNDLYHIEGVTPVRTPLRVLGLPFAPDGSGYYRMYLPFKHLAENSGDMIMITPPGKHFVPTEEQVAQCDVVAMQRPLGYEGHRVWSSWKQHAKLVYETDDDLLQATTSGLPHLFDENVRQTVRDCLAVSDLITVSTEPLAEQMRKHNDNVVVLPNFVNAELLKLQRQSTQRLTIGWAGGASHLGDLAVAQEPLAEVLAAHPDVDMHFIGNDYSPLMRRECRWTVWQLDVWSYYQAIDFDIGVIPLAHHPFNDSKSHIKALEFAALGIPVVASNEPPYRDFVIDGVTGYLVDSDDEWRSRLTDLINDEAMRAEMGQKAKAVAAGWTIQKNWLLWSNAYREVVGR